VKFKCSASFVVVSKLRTKTGRIIDNFTVIDTAWNYKSVLIKGFDTIQ